MALVEDSSISLFITPADGGASHSVMSGLVKHTATGTRRVIKNPQDVGTTWETLALGDVTLPAWITIYNHGSVDVDIRAAAGETTFGQIPAGRWFRCLITATTPEVKAASTGGKIEITAVEK